MKITIIRHAKVNYKWKSFCSSQEFNKSCYEYDISPIDLSNKYSISTKQPIYISELSRSYDTAKLIFGSNKFIRMNLFNEVPLRAFTDKEIKLPLIIWRIFGRIQWYMNSKKQIETKNETYKRAKKTVGFLEKRNQDCFIICHACYMKVLLKELRYSGYIGNHSRIHIMNLQKFVFIKE
ncbi:hypothetical protein [Clostridium beijerinckii]|uniref:hypothetical protein n=1 Tax=Clostridium beijerinckii TaxID=1520 RepID=UPI00047C2358|nr:hypothetical protein [Clostridium beijerinckii]